MIWIGILLTLATAVGLMVRRGEGPSGDPRWDEFSRDAEALDKVIARVARPLSGTSLVRQRGGGSASRSLETLLNAGRTYGGSIEIFVSATVACSLGSAALLLLALGLGLSGLPLLLFTGFATLLAAYPWNQLVSRAKTRTASINADLPDFIELLVMVLPSTSPLPALSFTAERASGPVSSEIRALVRTVSSRGVATDLEAFEMASERLATPEARTFITTLKNAYIEGTPAVDSLVQQGEALRRALFQRQRARAKRMPTTLVIVFALHFMPLLIVLALLPVVVGLGQGI
jgi:Flp pilus assembly protein TadB